MSYQFEWKDREFWTYMTSKAHNGAKITISLEGEEKGIDTKATTEDINQGYEVLKILIKNKEIKDDTKLIIRYHFYSDTFGNLLSHIFIPTIISEPIAIKANAQETVKVIIDMIPNLFSNLEGIFKERIQVPFEDIAWIIKEVNDHFPINGLHYSHKSKVLYLYFGQGRFIRVASDLITTSSGVGFNLKDGYTDDSATEEMIEEFKIWKENINKRNFLTDVHPGMVNPFHGY